MLKYVLGFFLVFGFAVYVAVQDERTAQQPAQEAEQSSKSTIATVPDANHPQKDITKTERNLPSWYGFFRWPNGTTTWAILLTLLAIAEQNRLLKQYVIATKDGVEATRRNIALQFRPRLIVRRGELEYGSLAVGGKPAKIHYTVANVGGTNARILRAWGSVDYADVPGFWGNPSKGQRLTPPAYSQQFDSVEPLLLRAGEDRRLTLELDQTIFDKVKFIQMRMTHNSTNPQIVGLIAFRADIQYSDDTGIERKTGIWRSLDIETMCFTPIEDSEYEYQD
jgi:hypothetical protein